MRGRVVGSLVVAMAGITTVAPIAAAEKEAVVPRIQIAILLDTSGSMSGLIAQAKTQLWKIVNEFISARQDGKRPELQVALYEYGNDGLAAENGWVRQIAPLTTDLDKISEALFALRTNGGSEFCGTVIQAATNGLKWSERTRDLKVVYIAGNEPFTQGNVDFRAACKAAIGKGITINTIFCGPHATGISTHWQEGAVLADGAYMNIDPNQQVLAIAAPQDETLVRLSAELNTTYVAYGRAGREALLRQKAQDLNAVQAGQGASVGRARTKASANYRNAVWDLVDAVKEGKVDLAKVKAEDLPKDMQKLNATERVAYVKRKGAERAKIQTRIKMLSDERAKYVAAERKKLAEAGGEDTLDVAITKSIRAQAVKKNFKFE